MARVAPAQGSRSGRAVPWASGAARATGTTRDGHRPGACARRKRPTTSFKRTSCSRAPHRPRTASAVSGRRSGIRWCGGGGSLPLRRHRRWHGASAQDGEIPLRRAWREGRVTCRGDRKEESARPLGGKLARGDGAPRRIKPARSEPGARVLRPASTWLMPGCWPQESPIVTRGRIRPEQS
jgi:hypothetical protein